MHSDAHRSKDRRPRRQHGPDSCQGGNETMERTPNHHGTIKGPAFKHKHSSAHLAVPNHWFSMEIAAVRYAPWTGFWL
ncbi:uncharacterized protein N7479_002258 [Penicillium vulpinum]|uniref:uncharacterized protein n=1 Tax=Penicillium vulpinum TaxID=29845 RepID=UPI0025483284|nr:uncharacterized protein N7479_002258 [Penicillium vulpinum]KAJ5972340.1 hypothetical protein N7479_002258 [Penicillium vulpinum]